MFFVSLLFSPLFYFIIIIIIIITINIIIVIKSNVIIIGIVIITLVIITSLPPSLLSRSSSSLDGSQVDSVGELEELEREVRAADDEDDLNARDGRLAITVWSTTSSTKTITSTSVNSSTTFSLSYYCTASGAPLAPSC